MATKRTKPARLSPQVEEVQMLLYLDQSFLSAATRSHSGYRVPRETAKSFTIFACEALTRSQATSTSTFGQILSFSKATRNLLCGRRSWR